MFPQETGHHTGTRWLRIGNLRVESVREPFDFSAWPCTVWDLEAAWHPHEIPPRSGVTLNLDAAQMGLGGDDSWGAKPHPEYTLIPDRPYRLRFVLRAG